MNSKARPKFILWGGESYTLDEFLNTFQKDMHKMVDEISGIPPKKAKVVMFRDWILGDRTYPDHDQIVSISGNDFTILAANYRKFQTIVPYFQRQEAEAKAKIADEQEKIREEHRYSRAQMQDALEYGNLNLSYPQWKQKGRFVRQGEKSGIYTMDGTDTRYALFSFAQTDVAENRYKSIKPRCENNQTCTCLNGCEDRRQ